MTNTPIWADQSWEGFPDLDVDIETDVCVVGLGGSGLAAIDEALKLGRSVVGIDARVVAGEAAGRNGGFLLAGMAESYHNAVESWGDRARSMYQMTLDELDVLMSQPESKRLGSLRIADSEDELAEISLEIGALRADGFDVEEYSGPEGEGSLFSADGVCNPMARCRAVAAGLVGDGARLYENTPAAEISGGRVVTPRGAISAEHVVVAVDGRLEKLFPQLEGKVRTARLEMVATEPFETRYTRPVYTAWGYIYWQQLADGRLALGGLRDRFAEHSWTTAPGPTEALQGALDGYLSEIGVDARVTHRWAGHAGYTPDRAPIYTEIEPGVWVVGGYCGHGNVMGSIYGRAAVRSAVSGERVALL